MRRRLAAALLTIGLVAAAAGPAAAAPPSEQVTGLVTGSDMPEFLTTECSFVLERFDLQVASTKKEPGMLQIEGCVEFGGTDGFTFDGTFTFTAFNGATLTGMVTGSLFRFPNFLDFTLHVKSATKQLNRLAGTQLRLVSPRFSSGTPLTGTLSRV